MARAAPRRPGGRVKRRPPPRVDQAGRIGGVARQALVLVDHQLGELLQAPLVGGRVARLGLALAQQRPRPGARLVEKLAQDRPVVLAVQLGRSSKVMSASLRQAGHGRQARPNHASLGGRGRSSAGAGVASPAAAMRSASSVSGWRSREPVTQTAGCPPARPGPGRRRGCAPPAGSARRRRTKSRPGPCRSG